MAKVNVREGTLSGGCPYLAAGAGPPLVVFPGLTGENANPTGMARRAELRRLRALAHHFTVYVVNRRPGLRPGTTIADLADHYAEAIEHEFAGPVDVQGVSTGGSIAQSFAIRHPGMVRRLVLVATAARLSPAARQVQREIALFAAANRPRLAWSAAGRVLAGTAIGGRAMSALLWLLGPAIAPDDPVDMIVTIAAEDHFDASADLNRITAPTLIVAGERDGYYSPELFEELAAGIPDAQLRLFRRMGHAGVITSQEANREILAFLISDPQWSVPREPSARPPVAS
jgi:pimeloyl-ACP methyl ester carboxylesterase